MLGNLNMKNASFGLCHYFPNHIVTGFHEADKTQGIYKFASNP